MSESAESDPRTTPNVSGNMTARAMLLLLLALAMQSMTPAVLKLAAVEPDVLTPLNVLANPLFILGVLLFGGRMFIWQLLLQKLPLSFLHPFQSLTFIFVLIFGVLLFDEQVTVANIAGTLVIVYAIALLSASKPTHPEEELV